MKKILWGRTQTHPLLPTRVPHTFKCYRGNAQETRPDALIQNHQEGSSIELQISIEDTWKQRCEAESGGFHATSCSLTQKDSSTYLKASCAVPGSDHTFTGPQTPALVLQLYCSEKIKINKKTKKSLLFLIRFFKYPGLMSFSQTEDYKQTELRRFLEKLKLC